MFQTSLSSNDLYPIFYSSNSKFRRVQTPCFSADPLELDTYDGIQKICPKILKDHLAVQASPIDSLEK